MRLPFAFLMLAFARLGFAAEDQGSMERVYIYLLYDEECDVWGVGHGFIATECRGNVLPDKRCNFNEFVNFVEFGTATNSPAYYDIDASFYFTAGTFLQIMDVLHQINVAWNTETSADRIIEGRKSWTGLWNDLTYATRRTWDRAKESAINLERSSANLKIALDELLKIKVAPINSKMGTHLLEQVKDVNFRMNERTNLVGRWSQVDWDETVRLNPSLLDPKSDMFKTIVGTMKNFYAQPENAEQLTRNTKVGQLSRPCYA